MNILEEFTAKYQGVYAEEKLKNVNSPIGRLKSQPKQGVLYIDDTKITIAINSVTGAHPVGEPFRIVLHLKQLIQTHLEIFPKSFWNRLLNRKNKHITKNLAIDYCFKTEKNLLEVLSKNQKFTKLLEQDEIYIRLYAKEKQLVLTPKRGIQNLAQFENYLYLLKILEKELLKL